jgi:hypothetical protein
MNTLFDKMGFWGVAALLFSFTSIISFFIGTGWGLALFVSLVAVLDMEYEWYEITRAIQEQREKDEEIAIASAEVFNTI